MRVQVINFVRHQDEHSGIKPHTHPEKRSLATVATRDYCQGSC